MADADSIRGILEKRISELRKQNNELRRLPLSTRIDLSSDGDVQHSLREQVATQSGELAILRQEIAKQDDRITEQDCRIAEQDDRISRLEAVLMQTESARDERTAQQERKGSERAEMDNDEEEKNDTGLHQGVISNKTVPPERGSVGNIVRDDMADKFDAPVQLMQFRDSRKAFNFGGTEIFQDGLRGFLKETDVSRSILVECMTNEGGKYGQEYDYIVNQQAVEERQWDSAANVFKIKDKGHAGMVLSDFANLPKARQAKLQLAHVFTIRAYSGKFYRPWNSALRALADIDQAPEKAKQQLLEWATCISVLYDALILLSAITPPMDVLRGVNESSMVLPPEFTQPNEGGFAGGVEMAFMSTTQSEEIALQFSGGKDIPGAIFRIKFTAASRGADITHFSLWPQEEELLFPPFTYLTCRSLRAQNAKRYLQLDATVSTSRPDLSHIDLSSIAATPTFATPEAVDFAFVAPGLTLKSDMTTIELQKKNLGPSETAILADFMPKCTALISVDISKNNLGPDGAKALAGVLPKCTRLRSVDILGNNIGEEQANNLIQLLDASDALKTLCGLTGTETELDLSNRSLSAPCAILVANEVKVNSVMMKLDISNNNIGGKTGEPGVHALAKGLNGNTTIQELNVANNKFNVECAGILAPALKTMTGDNYDSKPATLTVDMTEADLSGKALDASGAIMAAAFLEKMTVMIKLDISNNNLTRGKQTGTDVVSGNPAYATDMSGVISLSAAIKQCPNFVANVIIDATQTELDLSKKGMATHDAQLVAAMLPKCSIGTEQAEAFGDILASHPTLKSLCGLDPDAAEADFSNQGLGPDDAILIAHSLKFNSRMTHLDISGNKLTAKSFWSNGSIRETDMAGVTALADALSKCPVLMDLNISGNHIVGTKLTQASLEKGYRNDDGKNYINSCYEPDLSGLLALSEAVVNSPLRSFTFSGDDEKSQPATLTVDMTEADLSGKVLGPSGAIMAAAFLEKMTVLMQLDISGNQIGRRFVSGTGWVSDMSGVVSLSKAIKDCSVMTSVNLANNNLRAEGANVVASVLPQCKNLMSLDVSNNDIPNSILVEMKSKNTEVAISPDGVDTKANAAKKKTRGRRFLFGSK